MQCGSPTRRWCGLVHHKSSSLPLLLSLLLIPFFETLFFLFPCFWRWRGGIMYLARLFRTTYHWSTYRRSTHCGRLYYTVHTVDCGAVRCCAVSYGTYFFFFLDLVVHFFFFFFFLLRRLSRLCSCFCFDLTRLFGFFGTWPSFLGDRSLNQLSIDLPSYLIGPLTIGCWWTDYTFVTSRSISIVFSIFFPFFRLLFHLPASSPRRLRSFRKGVSYHRFTKSKSRHYEIPTPTPHRPRLVMASSDDSRTIRPAGFQ